MHARKYFNTIFFFPFLNVLHLWWKHCNCALRAALCLLESGGKCHRPLVACQGSNERSRVGGLMLCIYSLSQKSLSCRRQRWLSFSCACLFYATSKALRKVLVIEVRYFENCYGGKCELVAECRASAWTLMSAKEIEAVWLCLLKCKSANLLYF